MGIENISISRINEDLWAAWKTRALIAALELDIFAHIPAGGCTAEQVCQASGTSHNGTKRLLDALVGLGYLSRIGKLYQVPPQLRSLSLLAKGPLWGHVQLVRHTWNLWGRLPEAIKSGRALVEEEHSEVTDEIYSKLAESLFLVHYEKARAAERKLQSRLGKKIHRILDLAAGSAVWSIPFAQSYPAALVTAIDLPGVLHVARSTTLRFGVAHQYEYIAGDVRTMDFEPDIYDLVILGQILHDLGEQSSRALLKTLFRTLHDNGTLLISESMPNDDRTAPAFDLLFGLNLLMCTKDGDVFTFAEYGNWLKEAGFNGIEGLEGSQSLILAIKNVAEKGARKEGCQSDVGDSRPVFA